MASVQEGLTASCLLAAKVSGLSARFSALKWVAWACGGGGKEGAGGTLSEASATLTTKRESAEYLQDSELQRCRRRAEALLHVHTDEDGVREDHDGEEALEGRMVHQPSTWGTLPILTR